MLKTALKFALFVVFLAFVVFAAIEDDEAGYGYGEKTPKVKCPGGGKPECPAGWKLFKTNCYKLKTSTDGYEMGRANAECIADGGLLASVQNEEENAFLTDQIKKDPAVKNTYYWIGMYIRRDKAGKVIGSVWMDGTPVVYGDPEKFARKAPYTSDNPSNTAGKEFCVHMNGNNGWNDLDCSWSTAWGSYKAGAVCKRPACAKLCDEVAKKCTDGWAQLDKFCYKLTTSDGNFDAQEAGCIKAGGHLASIHSEAEQKFVAELCAKADPKKHFYIGLRTPSVPWTEGKYANTDATPVDYGDPKASFGKYPWTSKAVPTPNNEGGNEFCAHISGAGVGWANPGEWNDINCGTNIGAVCKRAP